jgi:hypothetical protein
MIKQVHSHIEHQTEIITKMIKVAPLIATLGTKRYKELLSVPFEFKKITELFEGWERNDFTQYVSSDGTIVEITDEGEYCVNKTTLSLPETLDDFINDMRRMGVELYWANWIEENYEPKDFLPQNKIEGYYMDLLNSIDKGHELTTEKEGDDNEEKL